MARGPSIQVNPTTTLANSYLISLDILTGAMMWAIVKSDTTNVALSLKFLLHGNHLFEWQECYCEGNVLVRVIFGVSSLAA
jgi:hypothetical protein